jgi:hypothetical protein
MKLSLATTLALLVLTTCLHGQVAFAPATDYLLGREPTSVVAADVNSDGELDLISLNVATNPLTVWINDGSGGFRTNAAYSTGAVYSIAVADVNADGDPDLVCGSKELIGSPSMLTVLTNDGSGRFVLSSSLNAGNRFASVTAADVNGDGKLDLIGANAISPIGTLLVCTNNGVAGFVLSATYDVGNDPFSVVTADANDDGWTDLICANYKGNDLSVLTNDGSGGFGVSSSPGVGPFPLSVVAADVNGDGKTDLISANSGGGASGNSLSVLTNNGGGLCSPPPVPSATTLVSSWLRMSMEMARLI